jgi:hypothetical protein
VDSALNLTVERTGPVPFSLARGEAWEEAANRRTDDQGRATDLRKGDLSGRPLGEQATLDRIAAADKRARRLNRRPPEPKQARTASEQPQLERAVPFSLPDETPSDSLHFTPVGETKVLRSGSCEFDDRPVKGDALLGLDRTVARLTLPRLPAIHLKDGSQRGESRILPLVRFQSGRSRDARSAQSARPILQGCDRGP